MFENNPVTARIFVLTGISLTVWLCLGVSQANENKKFLYATPVIFQGKIAFITDEQKLINCSEEFKVQFKPNDSIYIFKELDSWALGIRWSGGSIQYNLNRYEK